MPSKTETQLSVPERHQLLVARQTLAMNDIMARVLGGMTKEEARKVVKKFTGKMAKENA